MPKNTGDLILRDRMEFTLDSSGDLATVYGRIDLSAYCNVAQKTGLAVKEIFFHVREQDSTALDNTGIWDPVADYQDANGNTSALKLVATARAFESLADVGIASPDVLCIREYTSTTSPSGAAADDEGTSYWNTDTFYGPSDMHPAGYTLVSDLLIGVAVDNWERNASDTLEIDILMIAEPVKVSQERVDALLTQAQDL
tara:strand:- start:124 stop:720 length:597 start_codon:yes stop_codon:yes gene_type:complete